MLVFQLLGYFLAGRFFIACARFLFVAVTDFFRPTGDCSLEFVRSALAFDLCASTELAFEGLYIG